MNTEPRLEIEVKVRVDAPAPWRDRLLAQGARTRRPRRLEHNRVYDTDGGALGAAGVLLRLRRSGPRCLLTLKTPAGGDPAYKVRRETETEVGDFAAAEAILRGIGLRPVFTYEKYREELELDGLPVMLDETPIGCFLEIEGAPAAIDALAGRLGFTRADYIRDSYHRLFRLSGGNGDMVFAT